MPAALMFVLVLGIFAGVGVSQAIKPDKVMQEKPVTPNNLGTVITTNPPQYVVPKE